MTRDRLRLISLSLMAAVALIFATETYPEQKPTPARPERKPDCIGLGCGESTETCIGLGCRDSEPSCTGLGCQGSRNDLTLTLSLPKAKDLASGGRVQFEDLFLRATVTGLPAGSSEPLYQFSGHADGAGTTSGGFSPNPTWAWPQTNSYPYGRLMTFSVTAKIDLPKGTVERTADLGPYLVVSDAKARWTFEHLIFPIMTSPRCLNCHVSGNSPTQGDDRHLHVPAVNRGTECTQCHGATNGTAPGSPPGAPGWRLPPFSFVNMDPAELCRQIKDPARNGGRTLDQLRQHVVQDRVIVWAWDPGPGRSRPPQTWDAFVTDIFPGWVKKGAACPEPRASSGKGGRAS